MNTTQSPSPAHQSRIDAVLAWEAAQMAGHRCSHEAVIVGCCYFCENVMAQVDLVYITTDKELAESAAMMAAYEAEKVTEAALFANLFANEVDPPF